LGIGPHSSIGFVGNLLLFAAVKDLCKSPRIDKVMAMVRVAPFFLTHSVVVHCSGCCKGYVSPRSCWPKSTAVDRQRCASYAAVMPHSPLPAAVNKCYRVIYGH